MTDAFAGATRPAGTIRRLREDRRGDAVRRAASPARWTAAEGVEGDARASTDEHGRFSIRVLKGLSGRLFASLFVYSGLYANCPELEALIRKSGQHSMSALSTMVEVRPDLDVQNVELRLPFRWCEKAKEEE